MGSVWGILEAGDLRDACVVDHQINAGVRVENFCDGIVQSSAIRQVDLVGAQSVIRCKRADINIKREHMPVLRNKPRR